MALAAALTERGYRITSGGTDNHLMLVDLRPKNAELTGQDAEDWMGRAGMVCNKNGFRKIRGRRSSPAACGWGRRR